MRYLKTYEKHHNEPNEGDYVICQKNDYYIGVYNNDTLNNFYQTTIGKIIVVEEDNTVEYRGRQYNATKTYKVEYNIPPDKKEFFKQYKQSTITRQLFDRDEILHFSKNREYLETILDANKYNL